MNTSPSGAKEPRFAANAAVAGCPSRTDAATTCADRHTRADTEAGRVSGGGVRPEIRHLQGGTRRPPARCRDGRPAVARSHECRERSTSIYRADPETRKFRKQVSACCAAQTCNARPAGQTCAGVRRRAFSSEEVSGPLGPGRGRGPACRATQVSAPGRAYTCSRNLRVSRSWLGPPLPRTCFHETRRLCGRCSPRRRRWPRRQTRRWRFGGLSRPPLIRPAFVSARASSADFRIVRRMQRRHARDNVYACSPKEQS